MGIVCSVKGKSQKNSRAASKGSSQADVTSEKPGSSIRKGLAFPGKLGDDTNSSKDITRKWVQPLPTPMPRVLPLITPDASSYNTSVATSEHAQKNSAEVNDREQKRGETILGEDMASKEKSEDKGKEVCRSYGGNGLLGVSTLQSGHSSVASDALSPSGNSTTHSSNSISICSSLSTATAFTPSGLHKWKLPPRLEPLPSEQQKLLLGHPESLIDLAVRPDVINLRILAPEEECMKERLTLWSEVFVALRQSCAERGFVLDIQDDLWAYPSLPQYLSDVLAAQQAEVEDGMATHGQALENVIDLLFLLLPKKFGPRLPSVINQNDFTLLLISLPDSFSTALLHQLYTKDTNVNTPVYRLNLAEAAQQSDSQIKGMINLMIGIFLDQESGAPDHSKMFASEYRTCVERVIQNRGLLAFNTVVVTSAPLPHDENIEIIEDSNAIASSNTTVNFNRNPHKEENGLPNNLYTNFSGDQKRKFQDGSSTGATLSPTLNYGAQRDEVNSSGIAQYVEVDSVMTKLLAHCPHENLIQINSLAGSSGQINKSNSSDRLMCLLTSDLCIKVKERLSHMLDSIMEKRLRHKDRIATGVPKSLIEELTTQTEFSHRLARPPLALSPTPGPPSPGPPLLQSPTLLNIKATLAHDSPDPVLVHAPSGWGLSTLAAQLVNYAQASFPTSLIIYRFMGISPDSQTLMSTTLSIRQQLDTILGPMPCGNDEKGLSTQTLFFDIVKRSTFHMPIILILESVTLSTRKLSELDIMTLTEPLLRTTKVLILSSDVDVIRGLRMKMKNCQYIKAAPWAKEDMVELFMKTIKLHQRDLSNHQLALASSAIRACPVPLYASVVAQLALRWQSTDSITESDLPNSSVEDIVTRLMITIENTEPASSFSAMMSYLSCSVGGVTPWEMADLLSVNDAVLLSIYSDVKDPPIHRAPSVYWRVARAALGNFLHVFASEAFYTHVWASNTAQRCALSRYLDARNHGKAKITIHREIADHFLGRWAGKKKPYPDPEEEIELLQDRFIMSQPESYGRHLNTRRFMCLPTHLMFSGNKNEYAVDTCMLNLSWLEKKIRANSVIQILCDLEKANEIEVQLKGYIQDLQSTILTSSYVLNVNNREVYKCLQSSFKAKYGLNNHASDEESKPTRCKRGLNHFFSSIMSPPGAFLYPLDELDETESAKMYKSPFPLPAIDEIIPITGDHKEIYAAALLRSEGEIKILNIVSNKAVRILTGIDHPQRLVMLTSTTAVVLCNRELYVLDLDAGIVVSKLRSVLNIRLPLFAVQSNTRVVALSRDRSQVQLFDITTGASVQDFPSGENRLLGSLLLSGDGRILVCGIEPGKTTHFLVWDLERLEFLREIHLPHHTFLTDTAVILHNGIYFACACHEVEDQSSHTVVIYKFENQQVLRKVELAAPCAAMAICSTTMSVLVGLETGQLLIWDLVADCQRFLIDGIEASMSNIIVTPDGKRCLTYCTENLTISSHSVALYNLEKGSLVASHTFPAGVTCAHLTPDGTMVALGIRGEYQPIRLLLVQEGSTQALTVEAWTADMAGDSGVCNIFGDPAKMDAVINLTTD